MPKANKPLHTPYAVNPTAPVATSSCKILCDQLEKNYIQNTSQSSYTKTAVAANVLIQALSARMEYGIPYGINLLASLTLITRPQIAMTEMLSDQELAAKMVSVAKRVEQLPLRHLLNSELGAFKRI